MPTRCASPIQGTLMRIVRLDACGSPVTGDGNMIVTEGFVQVEVTQQYQDGTEYILRNAKGELCVNDVGPDQFQRADLTIQFCDVNPDLVGLITGTSIVTTGAPATGTGFWVQEGEVTARFSLEVWQNVAGQACVPGQTEPDKVYWAFPNLGAGRFNDFTISDGVLEWSLSARTKSASSTWGTGPGADPDWISAVPADAHFGFNIASFALPATTGCAAVAL